MKPITGSIVALVTPMHEDGRIDFDALRRLIDWHIAEGTQCIGAVGITGDAPTAIVEDHAEAVDIPMVLYNVPGRTVADMLPETALRLAEVPGVIGIKEASGSIERAC